MQEEWARPYLFSVACAFVLSAITVALHNSVPAGAVSRLLFGVGPPGSGAPPVVSVPFRGEPLPRSIDGVSFEECTSSCYAVEYSNSAPQPARFVGRTLLLDSTMAHARVFDSAFATMLQGFHSPWATSGLTIRAVVYGDDTGLAGVLESSALLAALSAAHPVRITVEQRGAPPEVGDLSAMYTALRADVPFEPDSVVFVYIPTGTPIDEPLAAWVEHWGGFCAGLSAEECLRAGLEQPLASICGLDDVNVEVDGRQIPVGLGDHMAVADALAINALVLNAKEANRCFNLALQRVQTNAFVVRPDPTVLAVLTGGIEKVSSRIPISGLSESLSTAFNGQQRACAALRDASLAPEVHYSLEQLMGVFVPLFLPTTMTVLVALRSLLRGA